MTNAFRLSILFSVAIFLFSVTLSAQSITTMPKTELFPIESANIAQVIEDFQQHKRNVIILGNKPKKVNKPTEYKVCALANINKEFHYQVYVVNHKGNYMAVYPSSVQDNSYMNVENEWLENQLTLLTSDVARERTRVQYENRRHQVIKDSLAAVINDSLSLYSKQLDSIKLAIRTKTKPIKDRYDARMKEVDPFIKDSIDKAQKKWYNALPVSSKKAISSLYLYSVELSRANSAGGHDAEILYYNRSDKTIKYLDWTGKAKNTVNDYVSCEVRRQVTFSGRDTGPYKYLEKGGGVWENVIYNWSAKYLVITSITITYMDGSKIVFNEKDVAAALKNSDFQNTTQDAIDALAAPKLRKLQEEMNAEISRETDSLQKEKRMIELAMSPWQKRKQSDYIHVTGADKDFFAPYINHKVVSNLSAKESLLKEFKASNFTR